MHREALEEALSAAACLVALKGGGANTWQCLESVPAKRGVNCPRLQLGSIVQHSVLHTPAASPDRSDTPDLQTELDPATPTSLGYHPPTPPTVDDHGYPPHADMAAFGRSHCGDSATIDKSDFQVAEFLADLKRGKGSATGGALGRAQLTDALFPHPYYVSFEALNVLRALSNAQALCQSDGAHAPCDESSSQSQGGQRALVPRDSGSPVLQGKGGRGKTRLGVRSPEERKCYHCTFSGCEKAYGKSSHLKAHLRTHTD